MINVAVTGDNNVKTGNDVPVRLAESGLPYTVLLHGNWLERVPQLSEESAENPTRVVTQYGGHMSCGNHSDQTKLSPSETIGILSSRCRIRAIANSWPSSTSLSATHSGSYAFKEISISHVPHREEMAATCVGKQSVRTPSWFYLADTLSFGRACRTFASSSGSQCRLIFKTTTTSIQDHLASSPSSSRGHIRFACNPAIRRRVGRIQ